MVKGGRKTEPDLTVDLGRGLVLKNPVMTASGTFGYGEEASAYFDISTLGGVVVKGISEEPRKGNPPPRIIETPSGMLNSIGLQNVGLRVFMEEKMPFLRDQGATVIVNVLGSTVEEYVRVTERLSVVPDIGGIEVNISCPNVKEGGVQFGMVPEMAAGLIQALRRATDLHLMVKLSPNAGDIPRMAEAVEQAGADSVSLINTITGMDIDIKTRKPVLGGVFGGLSGPAIRPVALRMVHEASRAVDIPVVGLGGIVEAEHAIKFILAGAWAVQVGTGIFLDPMIPLRVLEGIESFLGSEGLLSLDEMRGDVRIPDPR
jgi:dihydroorotate dehydrogenase (NAD+) catalytic subunit